MRVQIAGLSRPWPAVTEFQIQHHRTFMVKAGSKQFIRDGRALQGIGFVVSIRPGDNVETEFGLMVEILYQWHAKHGAACGEMVVNFVAAPEQQESLMAYLMTLIQKEEPLRPLFIQLGQVEAAFIAPDGKDKKEYKFKMDA